MEPNVSLLMDDLFGDIEAYGHVHDRDRASDRLRHASRKSLSGAFRRQSPGIGRAAPPSEPAAGASRARCLPKVLRSPCRWMSRYCICRCCVNLVLTFSPARLPRFEQISVDSTALVFTLGISVLAGLGLVPFRFESIPAPGFGIAARRRSQRKLRPRAQLTRNTLTVVQVGLAIVLLIGSGLMIRTFQSIRRVHPGFVSRSMTDLPDFDSAKRGFKRCGASADAS